MELQLFSKDTFCTLPWSSIQINPSGNFKICCFSGNAGNHGVGKDEKTGDVMNIMTHSIEDALNSDLHKQLRLAQSRDEKHPVCRVCWEKESANERQKVSMSSEDIKSVGYSHRYVRTFKHLKDEPGGVNLEDAASMMQPDGSIHNTPIMLDIRFSNLCNAKCIQCEPQYSNLWYYDHMQLTGSDKFRVGPKEYTIRQENNKLVTDMVRWHDTPEWWDQFDRIKHRLRHIYITGGEPFLQPSHGEMLDRLVAAGLAQNILIEYDTNLMAINDKILQRLSQFKTVRFAVSVDDTEKRYELIRYPSSWSKLNTNLAKLKEYTNFNIRITSCIGIFSVYSPMRVVPYFSSLGHDLFPQRLLRSPAVYDLAFLPPEIKIQILNKYENSNLPSRYKNITVGYLKNTMTRHDNLTCENMVRGYVTRMDSLDGLRGTDWRNTFPEVYELLRGHYAEMIK